MVFEHMHPLVGHVQKQCDRQQRRLDRIRRELARNPDMSSRDMAAATQIPLRSVRRLMATAKGTKPC